jgi:hypothetical protein
MHRVFIAGCSREQTDEFYQAIFEQVLRNISAFVVDQATGNIGPEKESTKKQEQKSTHSARNLQKPNYEGNGRPTDSGGFSCPLFLSGQRR